MFDRWFFIVFVFLVTLAAPLMVFPVDDPYFRFWTAEDGFDQTQTVYVNLGRQGGVIASGANVYHHSFLNGYRVSTFPAPYTHAFFQQDADGRIWSYLTDSLLGASPNFLGFQRLDESHREWETFPIPAFADRIQNSTLEIRVSYIGIRPEGRFVCHPSGQLVFSYFDKVYSYHPESKTLDVILQAGGTEMGKRYDWSSPVFEGEYPWHLFSNSRFLGNVYLARDNGIWVSSVGGAIKGHWDGSQTPPQWTWEEYPFAGDLGKTSIYPFHLIERSDGTLYAKSYIHDATHFTGTQLLEFREDRWTTLMEQEYTNISFGWKDAQNRLWHSYKAQTLIQDGSKETVVFPYSLMDIAFESDSCFFCRKRSWLAAIR